MNAVSSLAAVQSRIMSIEQRLGIQRQVAAPAESASGAGVASAAALADISNALGPGGSPFDALLESATRNLPALANTNGVTARARVGASPFGLTPVGPVSGYQPTGEFGDYQPTGELGGVSASHPGSLPPGTPFADLFASAAERWGIPPHILTAVGHVESRFRTDAVSSAGALGVMQFMPATAASMGVNPHDPASAIDGAARLLRQMQDRFGSLELALAAYNVGPGTIARAGGIVPGSQSEKYVNAILTASESFR